MYVYIYTHTYTILFLNFQSVCVCVCVCVCIHIYIYIYIYTENLEIKFGWHLSSRFRCSEFKSGELHQRHETADWNLAKFSSFAWEKRKTWETSMRWPAQELLDTQRLLASDHSKTNWKSSKYSLIQGNITFVWNTFQHSFPIWQFNALHLPLQVQVVNAV